MARDLPTGAAAAFAAAKLYPCYLVEVDWPDGIIYTWNGYHSLSWGGHTWLPVGHFGGISDIKETGDATANGITLTLSGIPSGEIAEAMRNDTQGCSVKVYFGVISSTGFTIDPYLQWSGFIDASSISDDGTSATVSLACEKDLVDNRSGSRRYTDQDQQIDYPGDLGLQFIAGLQLASFVWGASTIAASTLPPASVNIPQTVLQP